MVRKDSRREGDAADWPIGPTAESLIVSHQSEKLLSNGLGVETSGATTQHTVEQAGTHWRDAKPADVVSCE